MFELDGLVKLASIGAAGVCVLAIAQTGWLTQRIPNDAPQWRVGLIKRYQSICVIIAFISALSGGANAYFNSDKIQKITNAYNAESKRISNLIRQQQSPNVRIDPNSMRMKSLDSILNPK
ncbi:MAG: hypothetical protein HN356_10500 [Calditrichaeota bacterium]|jgi:hypothetical protein|nr:hypothetical protein [Calditrichota bacterium]MBT7617958.1 hypothetical protein [Calditrichota bacterium]MBT7788812.1 hypothetical protein [Calditrichota bacterium]